MMDQVGQEDGGSAAKEPTAGEGIYRLTEFPLHFIAAIQRRNFEVLSRALKPLGLTPHHWRILAILNERDGQGISELAELAVLERTRTSRIVDAMEAMGLVERRSAHADQRFSLVHLNEAGRAKLTQILPVVLGVHRLGFATLSAVEMDTLLGLLRRVKDNYMRSEVIHDLLAG